MGVKGLATYLKDYRAHLCTIHRFNSNSPKVPVVVDGLGLLFALYFANLDWITGGEYAAFFHLTRRFLIALGLVGFNITMVFDGAAPSEKHDTLINRNESKMEEARTVFLSLDKGYSLPNTRFNLLPIFCFDVMASALSSLEHVETEFIPNGEADGRIIAIADKLHAFVLGTDSDFMILAANAPNVRGCIPFDALQWQYSGGRPPKEGLVPPLPFETPSLHARVYSTTALCEHIGVPQNRLSLLASIAGNDYSKRVLTEFWDRVRERERLVNPKPYWTIEYTALLLQKMPPPAFKTRSDAVDYVQKVLTSMARTETGPSDEVVDQVITAILQYTLSRGSPCCQISAFCGADRCPDAPSKELVSYCWAQRVGLMKPLTSAFAHPDRVYPLAILEDPKFCATRCSPYGRRIRATAYSHVFSVAAPYITSVIEYNFVDGKLQPQVVELPLVQPGACVLSVPKRLGRYLSPLGGPMTEAILRLPPYLHPLAASLRLCIQYAPAHGRWSHAELFSVVRGAIVSLAMFDPKNAEKATVTTNFNRPPLSSRNVQRVAQFNSALHDMHHLAQSLLIVTPGGTDTHRFGWKFIHGPTIHEFLNGSAPAEPPETLVGAVVATVLSDGGVAFIDDVGIDISPCKVKVNGAGARMAEMAGAFTGWQAFHQTGICSGSNLTGLPAVGQVSAQQNDICTGSNRISIANVIPAQKQRPPVLPQHLRQGPPVKGRPRR